MKTNAKPSLYFSAYPLKVLEKEIAAKPSVSQSPYLKAILTGSTRTVSRVRVFPMKNPYRNSQVAVMPRASKLPTDIELTEKEWFNNYE